MYRKVIPSVLGIFCLALAVQSQMPDGIDLDQFYGCFTYALCDSDGQAHQDIMKCFNSPTDQEKKTVISYIDQNYYNYKTNLASEAIQKYCSKSGDEQMNAFKQTLKGVDGYQKMTCNSSNMQQQCKTATELASCFFSLLGNLKERELCNIKP
ncbi:uncharacterized protein LOC129971689 [Argiope bruennichi]|uniref:uncharacterized protein LOC129971689 n=1 Tax=Argiope bruennichi TaxID=94029 RepID=UPI00249414DE|nr:uncharacterized protein LOC129971689 [Argiope bruennichi]